MCGCTKAGVLRCDGHSLLHCWSKSGGGLKRRTFLSMLFACMIVIAWCRKLERFLVFHTFICWKVFSWLLWRLVYAMIQVVHELTNVFRCKNEWAQVRAVKKTNLFSFVQKKKTSNILFTILICRFPLLPPPRMTWSCKSENDCWSF